MHADPLRDEPPPDGATNLGQLTQLRADFGGWCFQCLPEVGPLAWEARRGPLSFPPGGGIAWIRAESAERLCELLDAVNHAEVER